MHSNKLRQIERRRLARIARWEAEQAKAKEPAESAAKLTRVAKKADYYQARKEWRERMAAMPIEWHMAEQERRNALARPRQQWLEQIQQLERAYALAANQGVDVAHNPYWQRVLAAIRRAKREGPSYPTTE